MFAFFMLLNFAVLFGWLIWVTRRMAENTERRRRDPEDRRLRNLRVFWIGMFFWGLFLGCWYVIYLAQHVP